MYGGSAIASGGFGCVFRPSLKCKNKKTKKNHVSKLMLKKYATDEINDTSKFIKEINSIKDKEKYFIIPKHLCSPSSLSSKDKENYDMKCTSLMKHNITSKNVNNKLNKLNIIQLPEGGTDLSIYFENNIIDVNSFIKINTQLIKLLLYGIVSINKKYVYHLDVKSSNILIKDDFIRLIDWGLSLKIKNEIPIGLKFRPFHYNMPYSIILLNDEVNLYINEFLKINNNIDMLTGFMKKLYETKISSEILGTHHDNLIRFLLKILYPDKDPDYIIFKYMAEIIHYYNRDGIFMVKKYFKDVYLKNCDIWGFATVYLLFACDNIDNLETNQENKEKIKNAVFYVFKKYIIGYSYKPIPVKEFTKDLFKLNNILMIKQKPEKNNKYNLSTLKFNKDTKQIEILNSTRKSKTTHRSKSIRKNKRKSIRKNTRKKIRIKRKQ